MAFSAVLPLNTYPAGSRLVELPLADSVSDITVRALRDSWPDTGGDVVEVVVELSMDDGATFAFHAGFKTSGGVIRNRLGQVVTHSSMHVAFPSRGNFPRKIRVREVNPVAISTTLEVEVT